MKKSPLVSIIMGVYNNAPTLPAALDSILAQTYENWEFVICDDCSTDGSPSILESYAARDARFVLLRNEKNLRLAASLNRCLEVTKGELIARMDGDDIALPERFAVQVSYLQEHPEMDLVGTAMQRFSDEGLADIQYGYAYPDRFSLRSEVPFSHATIMTYKKVFDALGGYAVLPRTARAEDMDLWARFFHAGFSGTNLPDALYLVREDESAIQRRTFRSRWQAYQTIKAGHRLLGYPKSWTFRTLVVTLAKGFTPFWVQKKYRDQQKKRFLEKEGEA